MVALALMVSCMPSAYTISASEAFGDGTEDIFTDGEITSEPAAEESTPDVSSADQEETEQAQQSTLTYENDSVKVTAEALEDGALPQNTALKADSVNENSSVSYDTVSQKLSAAATDKGSSLRGFFAYDVYFADGDGNRVEPNGRVRVTFEYKTPAAPELTDAASTSVTVEKLHYNSSTGDTDVNTLQANEDLKVLNVNEGKQIQTLQVETGNAAVFAVMWDSPETADVEAEAVSGNEDEVPIASEELTDGMDISDEPEQDAAETPAAENPEVTPEAEPSEAPAENPDAEPTEAPAEDPDVVEEPAEDIASPEDVPAADENGETSLIEVLGDDTNLRVSPSIEAEVLATVNAGTQLTLLDTVTAEDGATWYKVSWEGTEAYIRSDMAQVVDSSDEAEEPEDVQAEEIQPEITRYDYKSDEVNVKVTLTDPADLPDNAELSVTPVELSQEAEDQITEEAIKEKKAIEKIHSYDIKFLVDDEEVQPGATVKVSVSLNDEKKIKDADVYHVDENDNVENMDGSVAKNGDVEFETTHFSTYVIVNNSLSGKVEVRLQHYCGDTKIYADTVRHIEVGGKIPDYRATENYDIEKVVFVENGKETRVSNIYEVQVVSDTVVKIYYTPKSTTENGDVVFYDYQISPVSGRGINDASHYPEDSKENNRMIMGTQDQTGLKSYNALGNNGKNANIFKDDKKVTTGLVTGLSSDYKKVFWKVDQPGFFTDDYLGEDEGKEKYTSYKLLFSKTGNNYKLTGVNQPGGNNFKWNEDGSNFFPLENPIYDQTQGGRYYFGMRYDIEFKLGDYVGPLNYTFTGDDDLWVLLDGKVVIDVGGIHESIECSTDLWQNLGFEEGKGAPTDEEKNKTHRITVLYMERGAFKSNCKMDFTIPDARFVNVENVPLADLTLTKVDSKGKGISGAKFKLVNDNGGETYPITTSDDKGSVTFNNLKEGTYTLTETMAPNGYEASQESWIVKVTSSDDKKAVATLYKADGTTKIEKDPDSSYHIMNYTQEEIIESSMDYSKTATVRDWDARTYDINITAASTSTSTITTTEKAIADIMLVLDVSGSMDETIETTESYEPVGYNTSAVRKTLDKDKTYYVEVDGSYQTMRYKRTGLFSGEWRIGNATASNCPSTYKIYTKKTVSMTRLDALKNSVDQFITDTASKSPKSKIGITAFSRDGKGCNGESIDLKEAKSGEQSLKKFIDKLYAEGGTDPQVGLNDAKNKLDKLKDDGRPKYVILFTDGMLTGKGSTWNIDAQRAAETSANALKTAGYTVYTIGYGFDDNSNEARFLAGDGTKNYPGIASPNCAFTANDATRLGEIFRDIQNTITQDIAITGAKVTDVIDSRFDLLDENGSPIVLEEGGTANAYGGTVSLVNGCYQIQWTDQTIPNKKKNGEWNKTIKVKAKDNFVGENNVTTNVSPGSKIHTGYGDVELPQPTVNVKVNLVVKDKDVWIYKGDPVPTDETILNQLFNESETSYSEGTISADDAEGHVTLQWFKKDKDGKRTDIDKKDMATTPDDDTEYYLEVTYDPNETSTDASKTNTNQYVVGKAEKAYNRNNPYGIYKIHVIKGQIQITKNVTETSDTDRTFTFNVNAKNGQNVSDSQVNVIVPANEKRGTFTLPNLPRGEYTVTEDNADGYSIQAFNIVTGDGQTDCESVKSDVDKSLKFILGNAVNKENVNVITTDYTYTSGGVKGVASYTNEAVTSLDLKKTDTENHSLTGAKFKLEMQHGDTWEDIEVKNGTSEIELNNLKSGIYKLTETTAPKGYSLLGSSIYFKVATGNVTLVDENGNPAQDSNMWSLNTENKVLTIKNTKLYSLPESGGPGTYGFTISGVAILATALLLFINNKRREEEAKRS